MQMCLSFAPLRSYVPLLLKMSSHTLPAGSGGLLLFFNLTQNPFLHNLGGTAAFGCCFLKLQTMNPMVAFC